MKQTLLKTISILFLVILIANCEKEETTELIFDSSTQTIEKTVSFEEAKSFFTKKQEQLKYLNKTNKNNGINQLKITPDWNSFSQDSIFYSDALLTKANIKVNRKGDYTSQLYFVKVNEEIRNVIFTIFKDKVDEHGNVINAHLFFNEIDGTFIDAYKIENGRFTKKLVPRKDGHIQKASFFMMLQTERSDDFWCDHGAGGQLEEVVVNAYVTGSGGGSNSSYAPRYGNFFSSQNHTSGNDNVSGGGGSISNSDIAAGGGALLANPLAVDTSENCTAGFIKDSNGNCIEDNFDEGCSEGYHRNDLGNCIANPILSADCRSFEYAKPPGALVKACAVAGLWNTFYAYGIQNGKTGTFEVFVGYPLVFFTAPSSMTNGFAANRTAKAVTEALRKTDLWFAANPYANKQQVGSRLNGYIINEMRKFGGNMTQIPPFNIPSPAPYLSSLTGTGNCL